MVEDPDVTEEASIVAACSSGAFSLKAFVDPRVDLNALEFPKLLLAHDNSSVPFREAEFVEGQGEGAFTIQINRNGTDLIGLL